MAFTTPIDTQPIVNAVTEAEGVKDSVLAFISGVGTKISEAVTAALIADNAADQGSVDAANAAILAVTDKLKANSAAIVAALAANP